MRARDGKDIRNFIIIIKELNHIVKLFFLGTDKSNFDFLYLRVFNFSFLKNRLDPLKVVANVHDNLKLRSFYFLKPAWL